MSQLRSPSSQAALRRTRALVLVALAATAVLAAAAPAAASVRTFCSAWPISNGYTRPCGGHLEPVCSDGSCDPGFARYNGDPFPMTFDCPAPLSDVTVTGGCYDVDDIPDCSACGGPAEPPCPSVTADFCNVGCESGLAPHPGTTLCAPPDTPGLPCSVGMGCGPGLTCNELTQQCEAFAEAGDSCANPFVGCADGLRCTAMFECAHTPPRIGETCNPLALTDECDDDAFCKVGFPSRCRERRGVGEACGPLAPCVAGARCQACLLGEECDAAFQCFPAPTPGALVMTPELCEDLAAEGPHRAAILSGQTLTFAAGLEPTFPVEGVFEVMEEGVAYGQDGSYTCYVSSCWGLNADIIGVEAYEAIGRFDDISDVPGSSKVYFAEGQIPGSIANVAISQVFAREPGSTEAGEKIGDVFAASIGVGANPLPVSGGIYQCETHEIPPPGLPEVGPRPLPAPAPAAADVVDGSPDDPTPSFLPGTGALYFDGVDDALAVTDPAALAAISLVQPEYLAWQDAVAACQGAVQAATSVPGCSVVFQKTARQCIDGGETVLDVTCCAPGLPGCQEITVPVELDLGPGLPEPGFGDGSGLTLEAWIRPDADALSGAAMIVNKEGEYEMFLSNGELAYAIAHPGGWVGTPTGFRPPLGTWTHVAVTYDGAASRAFVNGVAVYRQDASGAVGDAHPEAPQLRIGGRQLFADDFAGQIDGVRVWARALGASELMAGLDRAPEPDALGLLLALDFSEEAGAPALDGGPYGLELPTDALGAGRAPASTAEDRARPGGALAFDGLDDHASVVDPGFLAALEADEALTLEAWVHPRGPGPSASGGVIVGKEGEYWLARRPDGRLVYALANASPGWSAVVTDAVVPENVWTHVALVYDAATGVRIHLDGVPVATGPGSGAIGDAVDALDQLRIGGRQTDDAAPPGGGQRFDGLIDEVRIWSVARSDSQIASYFDRPVRAGAAGLVGWWRFDEGPTGVAFDSSVGDRHALLGAGRIIETPRRTDALAFLEYPSSAADPIPASSSACGLGAELAVLLPLWRWLLRRRRCPA